MWDRIILLPRTSLAPGATPDHGLVASLVLDVLREGEGELDLELRAGVERWGSRRRNGSSRWKDGK